MISQAERVRFAEHYKKMEQSIDEDPVSALLGFRKWVESICFAIFESNFKHTADPYLSLSIAAFLRKEKLIPDIIYLHMRLILILTEGSQWHNRERIVQHLKPCTHSAAVLSKWYLNVTLGGE